MKTILLTIALLVGTVAQAKIADSQYDARHQAMLTDASLRACGVAGGKLTELSSSVVRQKVDQGIVDLYFTTELELVVKIDQGMFDTFTVKAQTMLADGYDHAAQDWGMYSVQAISCELAR